MAEKSLIIGGAGFVGGYLTGRLLNSGNAVTVTKLENERTEYADVKTVNLELTDEKSVRELINTELPDTVYHLAAVSSVALSWKNPSLTVDVNIKGAINLLNAVRDCEKSMRVLMIGSGEEYGTAAPEELPLNESSGLHPGNIYAVTKICQNMISSLYARAYGMDVMMVRAFNHCGPGQSDMFVISDFAKQIAEAEQGKREAVIKTGNLTAKRDFTDVRDVVRAYELIMRCGESGETYNVGSGRAWEISELLEKLVSLSSCKIRVETDAERFRPVDVPEIRADITKLTAQTGWRPEITIEKTLSDTLDYWRKKIQ